MWKYKDEINPVLPKLLLGMVFHHRIETSLQLPVRLRYLFFYSSPSSHAGLPLFSSPNSHPTGPLNLLCLLLLLLPTTGSLSVFIVTA